jgi:hypothetical protein
MEKTYTFDPDIFSDLYKDVRGSRPRNYIFYTYIHMNQLENAQRIWDTLLKDHAREMER